VEADTKENQKAILAMQAQFGSLQDNLNSKLGDIRKELTVNRIDTVKAIAGVEKSVDAAVAKIDVTNTKLEATNAKLDGVTSRLWPNQK
jgi:hypothetical protein